MSVCPYERWDLGNYKSSLGLGMQISKIPAQRKFVSAECHAHSAHAAQICGSYSFDARIKILSLKTVAPKILMLQ